MKTQVSTFATCGFALIVLATTGARVLLSPAEARTTGPTTSYRSPVVHPNRRTQVESEQRRVLNARLQEMISSGDGARLGDVTQAPPGRAAPRPHSPMPGRDPQYRPPRLDLATAVERPSDPIACLTQAIYYEARNESAAGQAAVAEIVLNRSRSGRYPRDICEVVYQRNSRTCQFTFTCDGSMGRRPINATAWNRAETIARNVHAGRSENQLPRNAFNYHANYVAPRWANRLERVRQIGAHIFYGAARPGHVTPGSARQPLFAATERRLDFVRNAELEKAYARLFAPSGNEAPQTASR